MLASLSSLRRLLSGNPRGYLCVLGSFLLSLALSLDYSYPNLNTYIVSYLRQNGFVQLHNKQYCDIEKIIMIIIPATTPLSPTRTSSS